MYNHNLGETEWQQIPVIFPDDMAVALYKQGGSIFRKVMYGDSDPVAFWTHCIEHSQWFKDHPLSKYPNYNGLIPISVYGDDVNTFRNSEVGACSVVAWTPDLAYANESILRYFPMCVCGQNTVLLITHIQT